MPQRKITARDRTNPPAMLSPEVPAWLPERKQWQQAEYDGVKGTPPEWVPEPHIKQFHSARGHLFFLVEEKKATYTEIRSRFDFLIQNKYGAFALALTKDTKPYDEYLSILVELYRVSQLGPVEGLRVLGGDIAVAGFLVRTGPAKRKAARDKPEIQRIGKKYWKAHLKATVKEIQNCEEFKAYMKDKKPYADRTIANWLREVDPRPLSAKRGPRSLRH
jgi:hypothetical protein